MLSPPLAHPAYAAPSIQQPLFQLFSAPPSLPALPKLIHDSDREFTDLKLALDYLLNPHMRTKSTGSLWSSWTSSSKFSWARPKERLFTTGEFTAYCLALAKQSYPTATLRKCYQLLINIPIPSLDKVQPLILFGTDNTNPIVSKEPDTIRGHSWNDRKASEASRRSL